MNPTRLSIGGLLVLAVGFLAAGCGGLSSPQGWASPVFDDDTVYIFQERGRLSAIDLAAGVPAPVDWWFPNSSLPGQDGINLEAVYSAPVLDADRVYFAGYEDGLFALDKSDGSLAWRLSGIDGSVVGGPTLHEGILAFGTTEGRFYVIDAARGTAADAWPRDGLNLRDQIYAAPVAVDGVLYIATMGGELFAYDIQTAQQLWDAPFKTGAAIAELTLLPDGETLFVPTFGRRVYLVDRATGRARFEQPFRTGDWVWSSPVVAGDVAYFGDFGGNVYALDITTNQPVWPEPAKTEGRVKARPAIAGDTLVVVDREPAVYFIARGNGQQLGVFQIEGAGTVRANLVDRDGTIYFTTTRGRLFTIDPATRSASQVPLGEAGS